MGRNFPLQLLLQIGTANTLVTDELGGIQALLPSLSPSSCFSPSLGLLMALPDSALGTKAHTLSFGLVPQNGKMPLQLWYLICEPPD